MSYRCLSVVLALVTTTCGGDDEERDPPPDIGTCDLRTTRSSCIELHGGSSGDLENQEAGCLDASGEWSNAACPTSNLLGCCDYDMGNAFHECFYQGHASSLQALETACADLDGTWTPAS